MTIDSEYQTEWSLEFAAKLENLAKLMRTHPGFNWSNWNPGTVYVDNAAEMAEVVRRIGRGRWTKASNDWSFSCILKSPDNAHLDITVQADRSSVCERVGEEAVETVTEIDEAVIEAVRAGETKVVTTKVKPIWKCPTSVLAVAPDIPAELVEAE